MLKTLDRYIFREISITWLAVTMVLLVIMVANVLARILSKVTDGTLSADLLLILVGVKAINLLVTLIPLGLYLGVLLAFGRLYRDSEMSAMSACAVGLKSIYRPVVLNGLIGVILIAVLTLWASPWAARYERNLTENAAAKSVTGLLTAGRFVEILDGSAVVFTESLSADKEQFRNVFVHRQREDGSFEVETAKFATYQRDELSRDEFMVFVDGVSTVARSGDDNYQFTRFARHGIRIPRQQAEITSLATSAQTLSELWRSDSLKSTAEIQWRVSIPLAAMLLALLAVPLAYTSPRQGRYSKIAIAILIYVPYANLLVLSRKWLAAGTLPPVLGLWWVHLLFLGLVLVLTVHRYGVFWSSAASRELRPA